MHEINFGIIFFFSSINKNSKSYKKPLVFICLKIFLNEELNPFSPACVSFKEVNLKILKIKFKK